jgi:hypothetical protein
MDEREVIEMAQREMETRGLGPRQVHAGQDDLRQRVEALEKAMDDLGRPKGLPRVSTLLDEEGVKSRARAAQMLSEVVPCPHVWRPIETAPKNLNGVLIATREGMVYVGPSWIGAPTHWMPFPEPPK